MFLLFSFTSLLVFLLSPLASAKKTTNSIVVVGSVNTDSFFHVQRLPVEGENLTTDRLPIENVPGGKGCTQAVAARKLLTSSSSPSGDCSSVAFVGQFGKDTGWLLQSLQEEHGVDCSYASQHDDLPNGKGLVFLLPSGQVSAVVSGGSNEYGWTRSPWQQLKQEECNESFASETEEESNRLLLLDDIFRDCQCVLLQREIPEHINEQVARYCRQRGDILVVQDVGGQDRPMSLEHLQNVDYLIPNETELDRLVTLLMKNTASAPKSSSTLEKAQWLQQQLGARNVLVTQGQKGCLLLTENGQVLQQPAFEVPKVVDETGAGDAFRAAFCVALLERKNTEVTQLETAEELQECLRFASAAGACAVQAHGAVPSVPSRNDVQDLLDSQTAVSTATTDPSEKMATSKETVLNIPRGDGQTSSFPFLIGSRLNSMKDRPELYPGKQLQSPRDYVERQATIRGLTCVDFNYPQHFENYWTTAEAKQALEQAGLVAGAVCLRYPSKFARGAMNHPDKALRREAIELTKEAAQVAMELGCREVVVWSAYDGYDYPFQVDYDAKWKELVDAFCEICDAFPSIKFSLEYKPTDENTRFFTVPSTGAALLLVQQVNRDNFGLTLDVGHMLMSGENPGQSIAMVGKKLFGIQLNDGFTRLAAEDGLMFGSVHPSMALEIMYQLKRIGFEGHLYFDTFPQRSDPVEEAEYNIERVKEFWRVASSLDKKLVSEIAAEHNAVRALRMVDEALRQM